MSSYPITINTTQIKTPTEGNFKVSKFNLTTLGRLSAGKMTGDLISKKVKLEIKYPAITGIDLENILDEIDTNALFFDVTYYDKRGTQFTKTFYSGEIPAVLHRRGMNNNDDVWTDVQLHFIEQ